MYIHNKIMELQNISYNKRGGLILHYILFNAFFVICLFSLKFIRKYKIINSLNKIYHKLLKKLIM